MKFLQILISSVHLYILPGIISDGEEIVEKVKDLEKSVKYGNKTTVQIRHELIQNFENSIKDLKAVGRNNFLYHGEYSVGGYCCQTIGPGIVSFEPKLVRIQIFYFDLFW